MVKYVARLTRYLVNSFYSAGTRTILFYSGRYDSNTALNGGDLSTLIRDTANQKSQF
jgi:hypothetical protein